MDSYNYDIAIYHYCLLFIYFLITLLEIKRLFTHFDQSSVNTLFCFTAYKVIDM